MWYSEEDWPFDSSVSEENWPVDSSVTTRLLLLFTNVATCRQNVYRISMLSVEL